MIEKIRKLRALADPKRGATEAEAAAATARMFALMAKHNLELSELDDKAASSEREVGQDHTKATTYSGDLFLVQSISRLNFCEYLRGAGRNRTHIIIGTKSNVVATREMIDYLVSTIGKLAHEGSKSQPEDKRPSWRHAFRHGCADRLRERIEELREQARKGKARQAEGSSNLPALANLYDVAAKANADFMAKAFPKLKTSKVNAKLTSATGYAAGKAAAESVGLHKQVSAKPSPKVSSKQAAAQLH